MAYKSEPLITLLAPSNKPTWLQPVAGGLVVALTIYGIHAPEFPRDPALPPHEHVENSTSTASLSASAQFQTIVLNVSSGRRVTIRPPTAEIQVKAYAPLVWTIQTDQSSGAALGSSTPKSA